jgi:dihydroxyacetone kinase
VYFALEPSHHIVTNTLFIGKMSAPKKFINEPSEAVSEFISGLLFQYPNKLQKLANNNVILSSSISYDKVNILSGGGSGHEPSHAGWIGKGMLTGAILGGIFASPSVASILAAIRVVTPDPSSDTQGKGCLLIVKNYTGDRLNFGMAAEIANSEGRNVKMVVVADDSALERSKGVTGARGVAGTVLVHKVAGAAAEKGCDLDQVVKIAQDMANNVRSLGVALSAVTIPGASVRNDRLDSETIEIGMGIHGEAGLRKSHLRTADDLASVMIKAIVDFGVEEGEGKGKSIVPTFNAGDDLCILVNNLGGTSNFEMSILANSVVKHLEGEEFGKCSVRRLYVGSFMTSFDMQGASVSIISLSKSGHLCELLDDTTDAIAWQKSDIVQGDRPSATELPEVEAPKKTMKHFSKVQVDDFDIDTVARALAAACNSLIESEPILTKYDTIVGDGDCGMTMERGAKEILSRLESKELGDSPVPFFESLAVAVSASMGGTSGILFEIFFRKMSTFLNAQTSINSDSIKLAFEQGVEALSFYGGATAGSRTMLDALIPAVEALKDGKELVDVAKAATDGAQSTAAMSSASAGRSNYLSEDTLTGTPDPGAFAVGLVLSAIQKSL